jgi:hypothetical protein
MPQWILTVSEEFDSNVRQYLKLLGEGNELSTFVQEAVGGEILRRAIREIQKNNKDLTPEDAQALADEAVAWARENPNKQATSPSPSCEYNSN